MWNETRGLTKKKSVQDIQTICITCLLWYVDFVGGKCTKVSIRKQFSFKGNQLNKYSLNAYYFKNILVAKNEFFSSVK